ncbi:TetR/AcrR family transcriptional regulator [Acinetobacter larvae]|uniref:TetR family transcriptional regulator n=1 Tax=Acinetobacter larvae TaxID=1789224 RepID=A0A1B2M170_9GAMM|nr:TetR/AcrR family transcriptional regulator [Acinetobacter larvae]AOA58940.1 TetR family transcriptional regulator [Acinetobacter larvae]
MANQQERAYHHGDLKNAIITTTLEMLHEGNSWDFTLREVARRAGVSHAAPYKHFQDKSALLAEIALLGFDRLYQQLSTAQIKTGATLSTEILILAQHYLQFARENPALYRLMFSAIDEHTNRVHLNERALSPLMIVLKLLERGQQSGIIRQHDVQGQATACWAQLHGLALLHMNRLLLPEKVGEHAIEHALHTLLHGLLITPVSASNLP